MLEFEKQVGQLLAQVSKLLTTRNWRMATAESCTGGWIAKCCTDMAGSSDWFDRAYRDLQLPGQGTDAGRVA